MLLRTFMKNGFQIAFMGLIKLQAMVLSASRELYLKSLSALSRNSLSAGAYEAYCRKVLYRLVPFCLVMKVLLWSNHWL